MLVERIFNAVQKHAAGHPAFDDYHFAGDWAEGVRESDFVDQARVACSARFTPLESLKTFGFAS